MLTFIALIYHGRRILKNTGCLALLYCALPPAAAEVPIKTPIRDGLLSSFALPFADLLQAPSAWDGLFEGFNGGLGLSLAPARTGSPAYTPVLAGTLSYKPLGQWFAKMNFSHYLDAGQKAPWDPDFSYSFGYDDWRPYTLYAVYENYGNNRFNPDRDKGERITRYAEGQYHFGWKFQLPDILARPMLIDLGQTINCKLDYSLTPRYFDMASNRRRHNKRMVSLGCHYPIFGKWFFRVQFNYYPHNEQQQPWDPDYTYEIGYFDWRPGTLSLQYQNYSANRYPWRDGSSSGGDFADGSFNLSWSWKW